MTCPTRSESFNTIFLINALVPCRKIEAYINRTRTDCYTQEQLAAIREFLRVYRTQLDNDPTHRNVDEALAYWESVE